MTTEDLYRCAEAFSQFGVSAEEAGAALRKLSQLLMNRNDYDSQIVHLNTDVGELKSRLNYLESVTYPAADQVADAMSEITAIKDSLHDTRYEFNEQITKIQCELCDLRSTLDAFTEKSNQKSDLEKIDSIMQINDWYENFIKEFKLS